MLNLSFAERCSKLGDVFGKVCRSWLQVALPQIPRGLLSDSPRPCHKLYQHLFPPGTSNTMESARSYGPHSMARCMIAWTCCGALSSSGLPLAGLCVIHYKGWSGVPRCGICCLQHPEGPTWHWASFLMGKGRYNNLSLTLEGMSPAYPRPRAPKNFTDISGPRIFMLFPCALCNVRVSLRLPIYSSCPAHLAQLADVFDAVDHCDVLQDA